MGRTPDRAPGPIQEHDHICLFSDGDPGVDPGVVRYVSDVGGDHFEMIDSAGVFNPRDGGGGGLPPATEVGQVLYSVEGSSFSVRQPLISLDSGWLVNEAGVLLVVG